jgi:hypothetical protein
MCISTSFLATKRMASRVSFGQDNATEMKMLYSRYRKRYDLPLLEYKVLDGRHLEAFHERMAVILSESASRSLIAACLEARCTCWPR